MRNRKSHLKKNLCKLVICVLLAEIFFPVEPVWADKEINIEVPAAKTATQENALKKQTDIENKSNLDETKKEDGLQTVGLHEEPEEEFTDWTVVEINSTADLVALSRSCWMDTWSRDKKVILNCDLNLENSEYEPIATFGGIFDGQNHTIEGFVYDGAMSDVGLFSRTQKSAYIMNLTVKGDIVPAGNQKMAGGIVGDNAGTIKNCQFEGTVKANDYVGGIAGYNEVTGSLIDCRTAGQIEGIHFTGGITGENAGNIMRCTNSADVNTTHDDQEIASIDNKISQYMNALNAVADHEGNSEKSTATSSVVDAGGIAGSSIGVIQFSSNSGKVGYEHIGYNIGGIAGRQSGYIYGCANSGEIYGRKDVGGLVGQAEPYVMIDFTQDITIKLTDNINKLHDIISGTLTDAGNQSDVISGRLSTIQEFTDKALSDTSYLADQTVVFADGVIDTANAAMSRADYLMDEAAKKDGVFDQTQKAFGNSKQALKELDKAVDQLDIYKYMSDSQKQQYEQNRNALKAANEEYDGYLSTGESHKEAVLLANLAYGNETKGKYNCAGEYDSNYAVKPVSGNGVDDAWAYTRNGITNSTDNTIDYYVKHNIYGVGDFKHANNKKLGTVYQDKEGKTVNSNLLIEDTRRVLNNGSETDAESVALSEAQLAVTNYADDMYTKKHNSSYQTDVARYSAHMTAIIRDVAPSMEESTRKEAEKALASAQKAAENLEKGGSEAKRIFDDLNGRSDLKMPNLGAEYRNKANSLVSNLQGMSDNMGLLNGEMNNATDVMLNHFEAINDQFNVIMMLYTDAIDGVLDGDYADTFEDNSFEVAQECTDATIADSANSGTVRGDIDVSGIVGCMAIEYDFDLESDVTGSEDSRLSSTYLTKCVIRHNINRGAVVGQKSCVAGICGLQEMGTVLLNENYAKITSKSGEYVGGIVGDSKSAIRNCYARNALSGIRYVGGIAGSGLDVYDCNSIVTIQDAEAYYGTIAGEIKKEGKVHRNYFVSTEAAGIDRVSYKGKAEPITYEAMMGLSNLPRDFHKMSVRFYLDEDENDNKEDKELAHLECEYGAAVTKEDYPNVVPKPGYYVQWNAEKIDSVMHDEEVIATYVHYLTTLASEVTRHNKQSAILADGQFKVGDSLNATMMSTKDVDIKNVVEHWNVSLSEDGNETHQFRYKSPNEDDENVEIYVKSKNGWEKVDTTMMGSSYLFQAMGTSLEIAVSAKQSFLKRHRLLFEIFGGIVAVILLIIVIVKLRKNRLRQTSGNEEGLEVVSVEELDGKEADTEKSNQTESAINEET